MGDSAKKEKPMGRGKEMLTPIASLSPASKGVNLQFIVLEASPMKQTKEGHELRTLKVADYSGSIDMTVWNEIADALRPSFICRLKNPMISVRNGFLNLSLGKHGELTKIGEITMVYSEMPNMSAVRVEQMVGPEPPAQKPEQAHNQQWVPKGAPPTDPPQPSNPDNQQRPRQPNPGLPRPRPF